jgi:hypothetical protein
VAVGIRHYGPWIDKARRDASRKILEERLGHALRPSSTSSQIGVIDAGGEGEDLGKTD